MHPIGLTPSHSTSREGVSKKSNEQHKVRENIFGKIT